MTGTTRVGHERRPGGMLWVTAGVLGTLLAIRMGDAGPGVALGEMVTEQGSYVLMTTDGGTQEVLAVVDNRNERLLMYRYDQQGGLVLDAADSLRRLFSTARARAALPTRP